MNWIGINCPVCGEKFTDNDDVVVCPVCGTPHHKHCWKENKGCINEHMHGTGFEYVLPETKNPDYDVYTKRNKEKNEQASRAAETEFTAEKEEYLDGIPVSHIRMYVRQRSENYIPKFKQMQQTKKKTSINIWAFLSPLLYSCYRKMTKCAISIMLLSIVISILPSALVPQAYEKFAPEKFKVYNEQLDNYENTVATATSQAQVINAMSEVLQNEVLVVTNVVTGILQLLMHLIFGLFANYFYMRKVLDDIRLLARSFANNPDQYTFMLSRRGGGSTAMIFCGIFANMMINTFVGFL